MSNFVDILLFVTHVFDVLFLGFFTQVGDSVVSKARETLERAIHLVEATPHWGAQVVYGDTDSLFVLVPGKSREQAFKIGAEIVEAVTLDNPKPVKLKLEKVYQPCVLQVSASAGLNLFQK
jgi:DNA polymerase zeta